MKLKHFFFSFLLRLQTVIDLDKRLLVFFSSIWKIRFRYEKKINSNKYFYIYGKFPACDVKVSEMLAEKCVCMCVFLLSFVPRTKNSWRTQNFVVGIGKLKKKKFQCSMYVPSQSIPFHISHEHLNYTRTKNRQISTIDVSKFNKQCFTGKIGW